MEILHYTLISLVIFIVNFVGAISGGKGLILRPFLLFMGLNVYSIISSAIISGLFNRAVKVVVYHRHGVIDWKLARKYFIICFSAILFGAIIVDYLNEFILILITAVFVILTSLLLLFDKNLGVKEETLKKISKKKSLVSYISYFLFEVSSVVVGGIGNIVNYIIIKKYGKTYIQATAINSAANLSAIGGVMYFIFFSSLELDWILTGLMIVFGSVGSYFGVNFGIKKGNVWVKNLAIAVALISGIKLLFDLFL